MNKSQLQDLCDLKRHAIACLEVELEQMKIELSVMEGVLEGDTLSPARQAELVEPVCSG